MLIASGHMVNARRLYVKFFDGLIVRQLGMLKIAVRQGVGIGLLPRGVRQAHGVEKNGPRRPRTQGLTEERTSGGGSQLYFI